LKALLRSMVEIEFEPPREKKEECEKVRMVTATYIDEGTVVLFVSLRWWPVGLGGGFIEGWSIVWRFES